MAKGLALTACELCAKPAKVRSGPLRTTLPMKGKISAYARVAGGARNASRQTWIRRATASTISATAWSTGTLFFCSPLR